MATLQQEGFESVANGAPVTTSNTTFDDVGGGATIVGTNAPVYEGSIAADVACTAQRGTFFLNPLDVAALGEAHFRCNIYIAELPTDDGWYIFNARGVSAWNELTVYIDTSGGVHLRTSNINRDAYAGPIPTGQWVGFDFHFNGSTPLFSCDIFENPGSDTPTDTLTTATFTPTTVDRCAFGAAYGGNPTVNFVLDSVLVVDSGGLPSRASADVTAPSVPSGLGLDTVTATTAKVSWAASTDDTDAQGSLTYRVYVDGVEVANSPTAAGTTELTVTGLTANTEYDITVLARDTSGNESAQSTAMTIRTPATSTSGEVVWHRTSAGTWAR